MQNRIVAVVPSAFCNGFGKSSSPSTNHTFGVFLGLWLWPTFFCIRSHSIFATSFWAFLLLPRKGIPVRTGGWIAQLWPRRCSWVGCMWLVCGFRHGGACGLCQWAAFEHSALFKRLWSVFSAELAEDVVSPVHPSSSSPAGTAVLRFEWLNFVRRREWSWTILKRVVETCWNMLKLMVVWSPCLVSVCLAVRAWQSARTRPGRRGPDSRHLLRVKLDAAWLHGVSLSLIGSASVVPTLLQHTSNTSLKLRAEDGRMSTGNIYQYLTCKLLKGNCGTHRAAGCAESYSFGPNFGEDARKSPRGNRTYGRSIPICVWVETWGEL